jgi:hypothetical protein
MPIEIYKKKTIPMPKIRPAKKQILDVEDQIEFFNSCVYIALSDCIFINKFYDYTKGYKKHCYIERKFNGLFGGYRFIIGKRKDSSGDTINAISDSPWQTFLYSNLIEFPKVNALELKTNVKEPYIIVDSETGFKTLILSK